MHPNSQSFITVTSHPLSEARRIIHRPVPNALQLNHRPRGPIFKGSRPLSGTYFPNERTKGLWLSVPRWASSAVQKRGKEEEGVVSFRSVDANSRSVGLFEETAICALECSSPRDVLLSFVSLPISFFRDSLPRLSGLSGISFWSLGQKGGSDKLPCVSGPRAGAAKFSFRSSQSETSSIEFFRSFFSNPEERLLNIELNIERRAAF